MGKKIKVTPIGNSSGVVLPKEALAKMRVDRGDSLYMTETPNGYELSPYDPEFDEDMQLAEDVMRQYRNALRRLAK